MNVITRSIGCGFSIGVRFMVGYMAHLVPAVHVPELTRISGGIAPRTSPVGCLMCGMRQVREGGVLRHAPHPHTGVIWCM